MKFTYKAYGQLMVELHNKGYSITGFDTEQQYPRCVVLRHDIDMDLEKALEMAKYEKSIGVSSTYFIMLANEFYNAFCVNTKKVVRQLLDCGHQIGLHFDETQYSATIPDEMLRSIWNEINVFEMLFRTKCKVVSMHRPSKLTIRSNINIGNGVINTYSSHFFSDSKFISDSRMNWREDVFDIVRSQAHEKIQILTHSFWYAQEKENVTSKLDRYINQAQTDRIEKFRRSITDFDALWKSNHMID